MIGVTADTNIYISALNFGGPPRQFLEAARRGMFRLDLSAPLLDELKRVLRDKFGWPDPALRRADDMLGRLANLVSPREEIDAVPDDPDDNRVIECAWAAGSTWIVTGDRHLLRLGSFRGIGIVPVAHFLDAMSFRASHD